VRREESFAVEGHVAISVEVPAGSLLLRAGAPGVVAVSIDSGGADAFEVSQLGDSIAIRSGRQGRSARMVIDAPVGSDADVKGASLDVSTRGPLGALRVRSASGDVLADDLVRVDLSLTSGDCRIDLVRDDATLNTTSGDVVVRAVGGRLVAALASGDVSAEHVEGDVDVKTASGDVRLRKCDGSAIAIRTVSGDIRVGLPSGIRVEPELSTLSGRVSLPQPAPSAPDAPRRTVKLRLRSISGNLTIERANG
jgi:hypothetical protein